jgi:hypothetical protein
MVQHAYEFILVNARPAYIKHALATAMTDIAVATAAELASHNATAIRAVVPAFDRRNINAMSVFMRAVETYEDAARGADDAPLVAVHLELVLQLVEIVSTWHDQLAAADKTEQARVATRTLMAKEEIEAQQRKEREAQQRKEMETQRQLADDAALSAHDAALLAEHTELIKCLATRESTAATKFEDRIADLKKRNEAAELAHRQRIETMENELETLRSANLLHVKESSAAEGGHKLALLQEEMKSIVLEKENRRLELELDIHNDNLLKTTAALTTAQSRLRMSESTCRQMEDERARNQRVINDCELRLADAENEFLVTTFSMCLIGLKETQLLKSAAVQSHVEFATNTRDNFPWTNMVVDGPARGEWRKYYRRNVLPPGSTAQSVLYLFTCLRNAWAHQGQLVPRDILRQWPRAFVYMQEVVDGLSHKFPNRHVPEGWASGLEIGDFRMDGGDLTRFCNIVVARASRDWTIVDGFSSDLSTPVDLSGD